MSTPNKPNIEDLSPAIPSSPEMDLPSFLPSQLFGAQSLASSSISSTGLTLTPTVPSRPRFTFGSLRSPLTQLPTTPLWVPSPSIDIKRKAKSMHPSRSAYTSSPPSSLPASTHGMTPIRRRATMLVQSQLKSTRFGNRPELTSSTLTTTPSASAVVSGAGETASFMRECAGGAEEGSNITDDETYITGDFELVSANNVRFRVDSCFILASSSVFRDAGALSTDGNGKKVSFTDTEFETARVVRLYLDLVCHGRITINREYTDIKELTSFLRKWECEAAHRHLLMSLEISFREQGDFELNAFVLADGFGDTDLCCRVLELYEGRRWHKFHAHDRRGKVGERIWDPRFWPLSFWKSGLDPNVRFALARAFGDFVAGGSKSLASLFKGYVDGKTNPEA